LENTNNNKERLERLFETDNWSEEDRRWLLQYLDTPGQEEMRRLMEDRFITDMASPVSQHDQSGRLLALIHEKITPEQTRPRIFSLTNWKKLSVAAAILLLGGTITLYFLPHHSPLPTSPLTTSYSQTTDLPPGTNNATLTLDDGRTITLDSAANGGLAQQGNTKVIKLNGQISYTNAGQGNTREPLLFNTIATARANQYQLVLSDGSKVWLNAASSIRFPAAFKGSERKVEITGEAYFEVAKNPSMPFKVEVNGAEIEVLGTHFNVNAYTDESTVRTTLLEGAVKVKKQGTSQLLAPGQQARLAATGEITVLKNVDTGIETAWKDGYFWFNNTDIYMLMRQVSRWYDVEVDFKGQITEDGFSGKIPRSVPLSKLLQVLEQYEIHFKIEGKKIMVLP